MCVQDCMVIKSSSNYVPLMLFRFDKKNEVPILADCLVVPVADMHTRNLISILTVWWLYLVFGVCCLFPSLIDLFPPLVLMDLMVGLQLLLFPLLLLCIYCRKMCRAILSIVAAIAGLQFSSRLPCTGPSSSPSSLLFPNRLPCQGYQVDQVKKKVQHIIISQITRD